MYDTASAWEESKILVQSHSDVTVSVPQQGTHFTHWDLLPGAQDFVQSVVYYIVFPASFDFNYIF